MPHHLKDRRKYYYTWISNMLNAGINVCRARDIMVDAKWREKRPNVALRFDIDLFKEGRIKEIADITEAFGLRGSFYILLNYGYYEKSRDFFLRLQENGHEIGLHVNAVEVSHKPWRGRPLSEAVDVLTNNINKIRDDGFDVVTMCGHGILWHQTNKDLLRIYRDECPVAFNRFFSDNDCILTDSRGILTIDKSSDIVNDHIRGLREADLKYIVLHPESFVSSARTKATHYRHKDEITKEDLCTLV